jgi:hypothetical protein
MTKIQKKNIYIDAQQQQKENNISLYDYPVFNQKTGRQLKHNFGYYFKDLDAYYASKNSKYLEWSDEHKYNSLEGSKFIEDIQKNEIRIVKEF